MPSNRFFQILVLFCFCFFANHAHACMALAKSVDKKYFDADIVFIGKLKKTERVEDKELLKIAPDRMGYPTSQWDYLYFSPQKVWKGIKEKEIILYQHSFVQSSCDAYFKPDVTYLIYGHLNRQHSNRIYSTNFPSGTYAILDSNNMRIVDHHRDTTVDEEIRRLNFLSHFNIRHVILVMAGITVVVMQVLCMTLFAALLFLIKCLIKEYPSYDWQRARIFRFTTWFFAIGYFVAGILILFSIPNT